ncbi:expressed unknown protein [Seminavis robusta]|uniref:RING-type domain-containing protein n=1 Tax=Seminavis robusta TaxID=568900 RepID=A0A9N8EKP7_9STRA|nr:expressed unknown protein [Seminavis robusta]|eukprot:Sro1123_g243700.1 n/a (187) ;mRNA; f:27965-28613
MAASPDSHDLFTNETWVWVFSDPAAGGSPSERFGWKLAGPVFVGFLVMAFPLTALLMFLSHRQEARRKKKKNELKAKKDSLVTMAMQRKQNFCLEETISSDPSGESVVGFHGPPEQSPQSGRQDDGQRCMICSAPMDSWQLLYESNNSRCCHRFHAECIERWVQFQNTCPVCSEPFVILFAPQQGP